MRFERSLLRSEKSVSQKKGELTFHGDNTQTAGISSLDSLTSILESSSLNPV